jgi:hypothetical protein
MKAGDTFLGVRCVMFSSSVPGTITTRKCRERNLESVCSKQGKAKARLGDRTRSSAQASEGTQNYTSVQYRGTTVGAVAHRIGDMRSTPVCQKETTLNAPRALNGHRRHLAGSGTDGSAQMTKVDMRCRAAACPFSRIKRMSQFGFIGAPLAG